MTEEERLHFLDRLWVLQREADLTDAELARRLGVNQSYVLRLKSGARGKRLSLNLARRAILVFPELASFLPS